MYVILGYGSRRLRKRLISFWQGGMRISGTKEEFTGTASARPTAANTSNWFFTTPKSTQRESDTTTPK